MLYDPDVKKEIHENWVFISLIGWVFINCDGLDILASVYFIWGK